MRSSRARTRSRVADARSRAPAKPLARAAPPVSHARIWQVVARIPRGRVTTYGRIAALAGLPSQARLVGYALHALPHDSPVPWHRVLNARGGISLPRHEGQYQVQKLLLQGEGIVFHGERVDLARYLWRARRSSRLPARPDRVQ